MTKGSKWLGAVLLDRGWVGKTRRSAYERRNAPVFSQAFRKAKRCGWSRATAGDTAAVH